MDVPKLQATKPRHEPHQIIVILNKISDVKRRESLRQRFETYVEAEVLISLRIPTCLGLL